MMNVSRGEHERTYDEYDECVKRRTYDECVKRRTYDECVKRRTYDE
jgi:hypothetical protein